ncbi:MAG: efflux RND transporter periplasmic adaptor subunit [Roseibacillus sp.]
MTRLQQFLNLLFLPLIIAGAFLLVKKWIADKPPREIQKPRIVVPRAGYIERALTEVSPSIHTFGNTQSFFETNLSAQVGGEIKTVGNSFNAGNTVRRGDLLVEIDAADYLTAIAQSEASLTQSKQTLAEEKTRSAIAAEDWVASGRDLVKAPDFTLRKPQLAAAESMVSSAEAALQQARLNLERTQVRAPFDAIVTARSASPGNVAAVGSTLGTLISRDKAEVRLPLTPEQVSLIKIPASGSSLATDSAPVAMVTSPAQPNQEWMARLVRTEPGVDPQNQVIYVIAQIDNPFEDPEKFLPIGAFVNLEIPAQPITDCYEIPATALVEDSFVWLIDEEDLLQRQKAERLYSSDELTLVGLEDPLGEDPLRIAMRPLASFQEGQKVQPFSAEKPSKTTAPE